MEIRITIGIVVIGGLLLALVLVFGNPLTPSYEHATVIITAEENTSPDTTDSESTTKAVIETEVADTFYEKYRGLGGVDHLPADTGMLFVFSSESNRTMVMRDMEIGLDIIFIDANRTITEIHHAPPPAETDQRQRYRGHAQYVLELPAGYTTTENITTGDQVDITFHTDDE